MGRSLSTFSDLPFFESNRVQDLALDFVEIEAVSDADSDFAVCGVQAT